MMKKNENSSLWNRLPECMNKIIFFLYASNLYADFELEGNTDKKNSLIVKSYRKTKKKKLR